MRRLNDNPLIAERRHANGVVARVVYDPGDGAFHSSIYKHAPGDVQGAAMWNGAHAEDRARAAADWLAHPGCTGEGCDAWPPRPADVHTRDAVRATRWTLW